MRYNDDLCERSKIKFSSFKQAWKILAEHKRLMCYIAGMVVVSGLLMGGLPLVLRHIIDDVVPQKNTLLVLKFSGLYFALLIGSITIQYFQELTAGLMGIDIVATIKRRLFKHVLNLSVSFFDKMGTGKLISRIESDSEKLLMLFSAVTIQFLSALLAIVISLSVMFATNAKLALFALIIAPICFGGVLVIFSRMRPMFRYDRELYSKIVGFLGEHIKAIPLLRNLNRLDWSHQTLVRLNHDRFKYSFRLFIIENLVWFSVLLVPQLIIAIILYKSVAGIAAGAISVGTVWMFVQYVERIIHPIFMVSEQIAELQRALGSADRIFEILNQKNNVPDGQQEISFKREIRFENVYFQYSENDPIINNVSFSVQKGETVAIVGPTGSGKTTLISLLARFYDPQSGTILIDGINIRNCRKSSLRSKMSIVLQDAFLFSGNVLENLRLGRDDISDQQVISTAKSLGVWNFVQNWPRQEQTELLEEGANFSHGERQLLSFSRAMTFDPEILLLDEATSSIDSKTEKLIQQNLKQMTRGRTAIIVAHRLSTIQEADKILFVNKGKIEEFGTHQELLAKEGLYHNLFQSQNSEMVLQ